MLMIETVELVCIVQTVGMPQIESEQAAGVLD